MNIDKKENSLFSSLIFSALFIYAGLMSLWENENRFDYSKAAKNAKVITSLEKGDAIDTIAFTGEQDNSISLKDNYILPVNGFLKLNRFAEIYSWTKSEDKNHNTNWELSWNTGLDNNTRNQGISQTLNSGPVYPAEYKIGNLKINASNIHFIDEFRDIDTDKLTLSESAKSLRLEAQGKYFYKKSNKATDNNLGDERISYEGIPNGAIATYFGQIYTGRGIAKQFEFKASLISNLIQNDGILHHLVIGKHHEALVKFENHFSKLKWIVRIGGTLAVILGFNMLFSGFLYIFMAIPYIGRVVEAGVGLLSIFVGGFLSLGTIIFGALYAHPLVAATIVSAIAYLIYNLKSNAKKTKVNVQSVMTQELSSKISVSPEERFKCLVRLAVADGKCDEKEKQYIIKMGFKYGISKENMKLLFADAQKSESNKNVISTREDLISLVCLAMSDGFLSIKEVSFLNSFGKRMGLDIAAVQAVIEQVRTGKIANDIVQKAA